MAVLYNYCTYSGVMGGKYQSFAWDVCCPSWIPGSSGNPGSWSILALPDANWFSQDTTNPVLWFEPAVPALSWYDPFGPAPVEYERIVRDETEGKDCGN